MFSPHAPAPVVRVVDDGLQVLVPEGSRTGPIAVIKKTPDFAGVKSLIAGYADQFPIEWSLSVFSSVRMDRWAFPDAFGLPILEILWGVGTCAALDTPTQTPPYPLAGSLHNSTGVPQ
jgi:hypothetical protein